jgi:hypothetical protein
MFLETFRRYILLHSSSFMKMEEASTFERQQHSALAYGANTHKPVFFPVDGGNIYIRNFGDIAHMVQISKSRIMNRDYC